MNITSEDEALLELYENGKTSDKRYRRLPPQVIKGYKNRNRIIRNITSL